MEHALRNLDLWVWRYVPEQRNYPGLHFTGRAESCRELLEVVERLVATPGHRTIPLRRLAAEDEAKVTGGLPYRSFDTFRVAVLHPTDDLSQMKASFEGSRAVLEITPNYVDHFVSGVEDVIRGTGDWCICPDEKEGRLGSGDRASLDFWFWPCFGHIHVVK